MTHEKVFKREDGTRYMVRVWLVIHSMSREEFVWRVDVLRCKPKGRTWYSVVNTDDYAFRAIPFKDQPAAAEKEYLKVVAKEELLAAKTELWEKLKPTL